MASLQFSTIYSCFLGKITDFDLPNMEDEIAQEILLGYLKSVIVQPTLRGIFTALKINDYDEVVEYQLKVSADDDEDFTTELLARGMVVAWLEPQVKSMVNTAQFFGGKEQKFYSQSNHLSELQSMLETEKTELGKYIRDRGSVYNPYLKGKYYGS